ncbi:MAG: flp pilus-assembly TadE/G-like family protein [Bifidobacterium sp.]|nr:flp pilus-assembly TadE/G-like family protein [Bifidobacterium sp.]MCH4174811.1 flp pilus-assembly TadE/G-like family protein [Bifidobacterium sp.]
MTRSRTAIRSRGLHRCKCAFKGIGDDGSGSMAGALLILCIAVALTLLAVVGNALVCLSQARSAADMAALAVAAAYRSGEIDPCAAGFESAQMVGVHVLECQIDGEDAVVDVSKSTMLEFLPYVQQRSRAGPEDCDDNIP